MAVASAVAVGAPPLAVGGPPVAVGASLVTYMLAHEYTGKNVGIQEVCFAKCITVY